MIQRTFLFCVLLIVTTGCSYFESEPATETQVPRELGKSDSASKTEPEHVLLEKGQRDYERGLFSIARESFLRLRDDYPTGPYVEYASVKAADCLFEQRDFRGAARAYEEIVNKSPSAKHHDYVLYRAGVSHKLLDPGSARDTSRLERSKELFTTLTSTHPSSPYVGLAKLNIQEVERSLAENDLALLSYYEERQKKAAQTARGMEFKNRYGVEPKKFTIAQDQEGTTSSEEQAASPQPESQERPRLFVKALTCDPNEGVAVLEVGGDTEHFSEEFVTRSQDATGIQILSPRARRAPPNRERSDCIAQKDLIISSEGEFTFINADAVEVITGEDPPKIIIKRSAL